MAISIFENISVVQEGMETIAVPTDKTDARELQVGSGEIRFDGVTFTCGRDDSQRVLDALDLVIRRREHRADRSRGAQGAGA